MLILHALLAYRTIKSICEVLTGGTSLKDFIILGENPRNGGEEFYYCLEVSMLNSFCLEKMVKPADHQQRGRKK